MAPYKNFDSIIFDLDGTLWDSTANVAIAWQGAKQQVDYIRNDITADTVKSITGMAYDAIFEKLFRIWTMLREMNLKPFVPKTSCIRCTAKAALYIRNWPKHLPI